MMHRALLTAADFRGATIAPLSVVLDEIVELRAATYTAYRTGLGTAGLHLPESLADVVTAVVAFADPLIRRTHSSPTWRARQRHWQ
jgi:hypothetical protein